jgi:hypothetical protein
MYTLVFNDGEVFLGGEPENSLWNNMPLKPIRKIEYNLLGHTVIFEGYESYNHLVEKVQFIHNAKGTRISKIVLMAKKNNIIYSYIFDLLNNRIDTETAEFGKEYYGKPTTGWKEGMKEGNPIYKLI